MGCNNTRDFDGRISFNLIHFSMEKDSIVEAIVSVEWNRPVQGYQIVTNFVGVESNGENAHSICFQNISVVPL